VAKALGLSRQTVSEHTARLVKDGHLRKVRGTSRPALYRRTSNPLAEDAIGDISLRSHHTSRLFKVVDPPTRPWPWLWDKSWNPSGRCEFLLVRDILIDTREGPVNVKALRYIEGRSMTIWLDEDHLLTEDQVEAHQDTATETAILVAKEVQEMTGAVLGLPEVMQASHYAADAPPDVWLDRSMGTPEIETDKAAIASLWLRLPEVIQGLREDIEGLQERQVALLELVEAQNEAIGLVRRPPPPPSDYDGVAYR
jgi:hypothetical protein